MVNTRAKRYNEHTSSNPAKKVKINTQKSLRVYILDKSGSMLGGKFSAMKAATLKAINESDSDMNFLITTFNNETSICSNIPMNKTETRQVVVTQQLVAMLWVLMQ